MIFHFSPRQVRHFVSLFTHYYYSLRVTNFCPRLSPFVDAGVHGADGSKLFQLLYDRRLSQARLLLDRMPSKPSNVITWTATLTEYARHGLINEARSLFDVMPERNIVTWNSMLSAYVCYGRIFEALRLFDEMPERNVVSYTCILCGLARHGRINEAKRLFDIMPVRNVVSWNSMISALVKNSELDEARALFDRMPERSLVSWNIVISGYAENLRMGEARHLFDVMVSAPNVVTWTSLVSGYCRIGEVEEAYNLFMKMPRKNVISWTAMIGGFAWNGFYEKALQLFLDMMENHEVQPNEETFISLFYACAALGFDRFGRKLHGYLVVSELCFCIQDLKLLKSLIYMYSRFGMMDTAKYLFNKTLPFCDAGLLNSMMNGYMSIGEFEKAQNLFYAVPGI
ncbi:pentatricopeptide repeat-containing protein At1g32415, mitochondrial-like [Aristolochia californica]|uniref:pentatricopeptide repeat-containing protein At1g32415, mitochondrial-like n=1 Tax=Aristolochia californica TaxID=171875 RepID=UPI0035D68094